MKYWYRTLSPESFLFGYPSIGRQIVDFPLASTKEQPAFFFMMIYNGIIVINVLSPLSSSLSILPILLGYPPLQRFMMVIREKEGYFSSQCLEKREPAIHTGE